jgi:hypothetical protein
MTVARGRLKSHLAPKATVLGYLSLGLSELLHTHLIEEVCNRVVGDGGRLVEPRRLSGRLGPSAELADQPAGRCRGVTVELGERPFALRENARAERLHGRSDTTVQTCRPLMPMSAALVLLHTIPPTFVHPAPCRSRWRWGTHLRRTRVLPMVHASGLGCRPRPRRLT